MEKQYPVLAGKAHPLGATPTDRGINFSLFSEHATQVELLLFTAHDEAEPFQRILLGGKEHQTFHFWHCAVEGLKPGVHYAYRVDGPQNLGKGHRFDREKVLLDPYAKGYNNSLWDRGAACRPGDNLATSMRGVVIDPDDYDWENDQPPRTPMKDTIIYELHVGGFTRSNSSKVKHPGTFSGIIEKIPYLKELGITAVELLPVFEFDEKEILQKMPDGRTLTNYWGYSTIGFFAPAANYCVCPEMGDHLNEFRDMVKALHRAGIEIILDVVYNHTNEGNEQGPYLSFKGIDNKNYYHHVANDLQWYMDYSGCGNTLNCNHPVVGKFIIDSLRFWVEEMHVDGFRFDEGAILSRGENGAPMVHPPILWNIELMDLFADTKLIAEAWDAGGLYQIGTFPGFRWAEWNGKFRDAARRFIKGDKGMTGEIASRISGSSDLYQATGHTPENSINFICCHDGFTMKDLVSFAHKHNESNGEGNRDGNDENLSWNWGVEGETQDAGIIAFRKQQMKNFAAILLLSQGVPMILGGDEIGRTQQGNNNAYCQDNEISWHDWQLVSQNKDLFNFFKNMIALRKQCSALRRGVFFAGEINDKGFADIEWHGCRLNEPDWDNPGSRVMAFTLASFAQEEADLHVMINMSPDALEFDIPNLANGQWKRFADTSLPADMAIEEPGKETVRINGQSYLVNGFSIVILTTY